MAFNMMNLYSGYNFAKSLIIVGKYEACTCKGITLQCQSLIGPMICLEDGERALEEAFVVDGSSAAPQSHAVIRSRQHHADKV